MTIGIGIATKDSVVLAADSAITHGEDVVQEMSSLGEFSDLEKGVEERALKIVRLGTHAAAAIAGNAHSAIEALAWIRPSLQAPDFVTMWRTAMSVRESDDFAVLLARWCSGTPELYRCVGREAERVRPGLPVIIGSASTSEREYFETTTRQLLVRGNRPHMIQLGISALLAWRALNEVSFKDSIGGTPASLVVDATGTAWMPDTSIYVMDVRPAANGQRQLPEQIHRLSIVGREDFVAVASTYTSRVRLLSNPMIEENVDRWIATWGNEVLDIVNANRVQLASSVALIDRRLALLEVDLCQGKYIFLRSDQVTFGDELKNFFLAPPAPRGQVYSIPLGEPASLSMIDSGGPVDEYDVDLGCSFMILTADIDKKFDDAERVWRSMLKNFPCHPRVLTAGIVAFEVEPGAPRLPMVIDAWTSALAVEPSLAGDASFVVSKLTNHSVLAARLAAAVARGVRS